MSSRRILAVAAFALLTACARQPEPAPIESRAEPLDSEAAVLSLSRDIDALAARTQALLDRLDALEARPSEAAELARWAPRVEAIDARLGVTEAELARQSSRIAELARPAAPPQQVAERERPVQAPPPAQPQRRFRLDSVERWGDELHVWIAPGDAPAPAPLRLGDRLDGWTLAAADAASQTARLTRGSETLELERPR